MNFTPRLTDSGIKGNKYWYSQTNPFYAAGLGLPNCTAYTWGRFWEETPEFIQKELPTGNGKEWFDSAKQKGFYKTGKEPKLGAVICFGGTEFGHVAIVEEISENGDIVTSNSDYITKQIFYTKVLLKKNNYDMGTLRFQGFIYNPNIDKPVPPKSKKRRHYPFFINSQKRLDNY